MYLSLFLQTQQKAKRTVMSFPMGQCLGGFAIYGIQNKPQRNLETWEMMHRASRTPSYTKIKMLRDSIQLRQISIITFLKLK